MAELFERLIYLSEHGYDVTIESTHSRWHGFPFSIIVKNTNNGKNVSRVFRIDDTERIIECINELVEEVE